MSGRLKRIELLLSQEDYATILKVLEENLGELIDEPSPSQSVARNDRKSISDDARKSTMREGNSIASDIVFKKSPYKKRRLRFGYSVYTNVIR